MKRKRVNSKMDDFSNVLEHTAEFIPGNIDSQIIIVAY